MPVAFPAPLEWIAPDRNPIGSSGTAARRNHKMARPSLR